MGMRLGPFDIGEVIGRGATATVWKGVHRHQGVPVAVKIMDPSTLSVAYHAAFEREVQAQAGLDHPNVCVMLDYGTISEDEWTKSNELWEPGSLYLVTELAHGTLPVTGWSWPKCRAMLADVARGVGHSHARGIVHRDLKPANVLVFGPEHARVHKITDFGIALTATPDERVRERAAGTPAYMAPELIEARWRDYGPWSDLYALGCLCWRIATGAGLFTGQYLEILQGHLGAYRPPFRPDFSVPDGLGSWLRKLVAHKPEDRYQCAADALRGLREIDPDFGTEPDPDPPQPQGRPHSLVGAGLRLYGLVRPPLTGRPTERRALWESLLTVHSAGSPRLAMIEGGPGMGKSRLARWLCESAAEAGYARTILVTHSLDGGAGDGLHAAIARTLRVQELSRSMLVLRLRWLFPDAPRLVEGLADILRPLGGGVSGPMGDREAILAFLSRWSREQPLVLWLDDVQWSSDIASLVRSVAALRRPIQVVMTHRGSLLAADASTDLRAVRDELCADAIVLEPLTQDQAAEFIRGLIELDEDIAAEVSRRSEGVPLFAVQLIGDWVQRGVLELAGNGFRLSADADVGLPDDLHDLWVRRMDVLVNSREPEALHAIEVAAVLGVRVDSTEWDSACLGAGLPAAPDLVANMINHNLAASHADGTWSFIHGMLVESLRRKAVLEGRDARHRRACCATLLSLGIAAVEGGEFRRARELLERATHLGAPDEQQGYLIRAWLGETYLRLGRTEDSRRELEVASGGLGNPSTLPRLVTAVHRNFGHLARVVGDTDRAARHYQVAVETAREAGDALQLCSALDGRAHLQRKVGEWQEAESTCLEAMEVAERANQPEAARVFVGQLGILCCIQMRIDEAIEYFERHLQLQRAAADARGEALGLIYLANGVKAKGELSAALGHHDAARIQCERVGDGVTLAVCHGNMANVYRELGDMEAARDNYGEALRLHTEMGHRGQRAIVLSNLGLLHQTTERPADAIACLVEARDGYLAVGDRPNLVRVLGSLAGVHTENSGFAEAREWLVAADVVCEELGWETPWRIHARWGFLHIRQGHLELARVRLDSAAACARADGDPMPVAEIQCLEVFLSVEARDYGAARAALTVARKMADDLKIRPTSELARQLRLAGELL